ncbi:MAG: CHASE2 domain-containing protein [Muribaculaceae bacterium]|nr:CHASE2 domain-containing protein [Muribaculaceae bacterium]
MMIKASQKRTWLLLAAKATGITGIAFLLSFIISSPFAATISALFSSSEKSDFVMSDLFYQIADSRPVRMYDDRMVILDIGNSNREEIAEILSVVGLCGPKAVAIDVNFEIPGDNDSILLESLSSLPALVLPLGVGQKGEKFVVTDHPFFYADLPGISYGVVNFPTSRPGATVREYAKSFPMEDGAAMLSFPEAAAKAAGYEIAIPSGQKDVPTGIIAYHSREITAIPHEELADRAEELADKIVLVGTTTEAGDVYSIPLRHGVSGLEIHAYSLSTILDGMEMERLPGYIATIIAVVICYLMVLGAIGIRSGTKGLILRLAQILTLYVLVRVGYSLFVDKGIVSDFSQAILMIAFGLFSVDLWNGTVCLIEWIKSKIKSKKRELTT